MSSPCCYIGTMIKVRLTDYAFKSGLIEPCRESIRKNTGKEVHKGLDALGLYLEVPDEKSAQFAHIVLFEDYPLRG